MPRYLGQGVRVLGLTRPILGTSTRPWWLLLPLSLSSGNLIIPPWLTSLPWPSCLEPSYLLLHGRSLVCPS